MKAIIIVLVLLSPGFVFTGCNLGAAGADMAGLGRVEVASVLTMNKAQATQEVVDGCSDGQSVQSATITIIEVQVRSSENGGFFKYSSEPVVLELSQFAESLKTIISRFRVPTGKYDQIRLITEEHGVAVMHDGTAIELSVPSGSTTGIKIQIDPYECAISDQINKINLEFDMCHSFVEIAAQQGVLFKPVIKAECSSSDDDGNDTNDDDGFGVASSV
jgi:hypothetical protein